MSGYVIVTETGGDIPAEYVERYGIELVPMHVSFGDKSLDDGTFPVTDIIAHYEKTGELPRTSGCTPQDFIEVFDRIHERDPQARILYLAYSSVTTCSFESALVAAQGRDYVCAIDTKSVTAGQFLVVTNTARYLEANPDAGVEEVRAFVEDQVQRVRMAFIPGGLEFLRAGGRLSNAAYLGAQLLRIKPQIEIVDGKLVATRKLRGSFERAVMTQVRDFLDGKHQPAFDRERIALICSEGLDRRIMDEAERFVRDAGFEEITWIKTGCVIFSHSGPGSFGIAALAAK